ncbi:ABC-type spermidine/putrescine transport system permease subunit II [Rhizobium leguminosarum]|uniref:ABC-type spermidine/putrescine transport system permease subunit II n=1 Tax=Rhizobium leguminosarum TaxID=384 RepID=A0AAE2SYD2_RHILE|nr:MULTISPECIES: ABC transporter permease subunit [Rhizobium]MBB4291434.1 ABC-type spermidine/putrescine transport system permease subunit II [Rhizobium leguminosarum]MBB4296130.1 ABC-type spermidine/putrescine transport system permease subunit II [Rhizobium leguminosarum]MBB4308611.1 ABC-type spermidine/putrescine transport system permease subunit II [Rhizobium leguminosarum]MBB4416446.1 ABC-type spermidine/putrescine transport system permease subunit II [Rhizobium leguminosarum]MBB4430587.1 
MEKIVSRIVTYFIILLICLPVVLLALASVNNNIVPYPITGFSAQWFSEALSRSDYLIAALRSVFISLSVMVVAGVLAMLLAVAVTRGKARWLKPVNFLAVLPIFIPHSVMAFAMLVMAASTGLLGSLTILFIAYLTVAFPLMYRAFVGSLQHVNTDVENAARVFGMTRTRAFMETTMRAVSRGTLVAAVMAIVAVFNDASISTFLGSTNNAMFAMKLFTYMANEYDSLAAAYGIIMFLIAIPFILLVSRAMGVKQFKAM